MSDSSLNRVCNSDVLSSVLVPSIIMSSELVVEVDGALCRSGRDVEGVVDVVA